MRKHFVLLLSFCILAAPLFSAGNPERIESGQAKPLIAVSILPHQYAVQKIAGDLVETVVLVGPGQSPHSYEPTPRQMSSLSQADAWIISQTDFEAALVPKIRSLYPRLRLVDGTKGVTFRYLEEHDHEDDEHHHHDEDEDHELSLELDRHTWLGREPMKIFASTVTETLASLDPSHESLYRANLAAFQREIDTLFDSLSEPLAPLRDSTVLVYHPSFGYFLDEFDIKQEAVETGGKEPTAKALADLIERAREHEVSAVFVQSQFPTNAARNVARAIGAEVVSLDPLAYDWSANIRAIGEALHRALVSTGKGEF